MQISTLIAKLNKMDPTLEVLLQTEDNWCYDIGANIRVSHVRHGVELDHNENDVSIEDRALILPCLTL